MLQYLVDVQLPSCGYRIPKRRIVTEWHGHKYWIHKGELFYGYGQSIQDVVDCVNYTPLAIIMRHDEGIYPQLYILSTSGTECLYEGIATGRGSECYQEYLIDSN